MPSNKCMATSIIIVHNHPSGSVEPSRNDFNFTETFIIVSVKKVNYFKVFARQNQKEIDRSCSCRSKAQDAIERLKIDCHQSL